MKTLVLLAIVVASLSSMAHSTKPAIVGCVADNNKNQFVILFESRYVTFFNKTVEHWREPVTAIDFSPKWEVPATRRWLTVTMADGGTFTGVVSNQVMQESLYPIKEGILNGPRTGNKDKALTGCTLMDE